MSAIPRFERFENVTQEKILAFVGTVSLVNIFSGLPSSGKEIVARSLVEAPVVFGIVKTFETEKSPNPLEA